MKNFVKKALTLFAALMFIGAVFGEEQTETTTIEETSQESVAVVEETTTSEVESSKETSERFEETTTSEEETTSEVANPNVSGHTEASTRVPHVPENQDYATINDNVPYFSNEDISSTDVYHQNGNFDGLGRVTVANALVGVEIMPAEERGSISDIYPTGWDQEKYSNVSGGWLYNRSHLIGHQLTGNDDPQNIMTGTRWFNLTMLEFENYVAYYVETTENHVRYRVTPVFEGDNLVASGVYMEGFSIEDNGDGLMFNIYVPNRQPGVEIDYRDGSSVGPEAETTSKATVETTSQPIVESAAPRVSGGGSGGDVSSVDTNGNGQVTIKEAKAAGYSMPITSDHWLYQYMDDRDGDGMVGE